MVVARDCEAASALKDVTMAHLRGPVPDEIVQPTGGVGLAPKAEIGPSYHVQQDHCRDGMQLTVAFVQIHKLSAAVEAVGSGPMLDRLLSIEESEPDAVFRGITQRQDPGQLQQESSAGAAVVRSHETKSLK